MEPIRPAPPPPAVASGHAARSRNDTEARADGGTPLDPAVSIDLSPAAREAKEAGTERRGYERDMDSRSLVYRVTDAITGDVIVQIPNEVLVKARGYGRETGPPLGEIVQTQA